MTEKPKSKAALKRERMERLAKEYAENLNFECPVCHVEKPKAEFVYPPKFRESFPACNTCHAECLETMQEEGLI